MLSAVGGIVRYFTPSFVRRELLKAHHRNKNAKLQEHGLLTVLTYRLNFLLHGLTASGYYITNLILHAAVSVLVYYVAQLLLGTDKVWNVC